MINRLTNASQLRIPRAWMILGIAALAWIVALLLPLLAPAPAGRTNDFFYDLLYRLRPEADMRTADVVLVAADQASLTAVDQRFHYGWPWPRELWGQIATYLDTAGAKAIAFDIVFVDTSAYQNRTGDDDNFAEALNALKTPLVFGASAKPDGTWERFAPPVKSPTFGAVNVGDAKIYRAYLPTVFNKPSLALQTTTSLGRPPAAALPTPFLLHYYGPHLRANGQQTFTYIPAAKVLGAQLDGPDKAKEYGISPDLFKNKIVILCTIAVGTFDLKSSPLSDQYPGPEVQATAILNLLNNQYVHPVPSILIALLSLTCALAASAGIILPRKASLKLLAPIAATLLLLALAILLFRGNTIRFLPPLQPLLALLLAAPIAFAWTYFAEDRQRRFMLKALSKVVSPAVAEQLSQNPERLARGTVRTEITLLFSDLANFTDLSEGMDVQQLGTFMNRYLGEMSDQVLKQDGTLDKYIGDAVMCFWNAPLPQPDHAHRACRAALLMVEREKQLYEEFAAASSKRIYTRIGINTASAAVGFIGSEHLFNFTAMGDGVNLASRLEGANKLYGSRILLSQNTASLVAPAFWLRKLDVLRVKGKQEPMAVYQLISERGTDDEKAQDLIRRYEESFAAYQAKNWDKAEQLLLELSAKFAQDGPTDSLLARVREYRRHPPAEPWDGVYVSSSK